MFVEQELCWKVGGNAESLIFFLVENGDVFHLPKLNEPHWVFEKKFIDFYEVGVGGIFEKSRKFSLSFFSSAGNSVSCTGVHIYNRIFAGRKKGALESEHVFLCPRFRLKINLFLGKTIFKISGKRTSKVILCTPENSLNLLWRVSVSLIMWSGKRPFIFLQGVPFLGLGFLKNF